MVALKLSNVEGPRFGASHINFAVTQASCHGWRLVHTDLYKRHRFPTETTSHYVWPYHRFDMSFRAVEELLFERGVVLSYETVRRLPRLSARPHRRCTREI
jgi:uncharacterized Fe-S cluster-containing radical SAM superfamily enzyme